MLTVYWHGKKWKHRTLLAAGRRLRDMEDLFDGRQARCEDEEGFDLTPEAWAASDAERAESEALVGERNGDEMNEPTKGPYEYDNQIGFIYGSGGGVIAEVRGAESVLQQNATGMVLAASWDLLDVCELLAERITECRGCDGTGDDPFAPGDACRDCGGQGNLLDATPLISDIQDAIAKTRDKK